MLVFGGYSDVDAGVHTPITRRVFKSSVTSVTSVTLSQHTL